MSNLTQPQILAAARMRRLRPEGEKPGPVWNAWFRCINNKMVELGLDHAAQIGEFENRAGVR